MRATATLDRPFPGELAAAVGIQGIGWVRLHVGRGLFAIEYIVRGKMNEQRAQPRRLLGKNRRSVAVYGKRKCFFSLGLIDRRVGASVDDDLGPNLTYSGRDRTWIGKIELRPRRCHKFTERRKGRHQRGPDLPALTGKENSQANVSASFKGTPLRSFSAR